MSASCSYSLFRFCEIKLKNIYKINSLFRNYNNRRYIAEFFKKMKNYTNESLLNYTNNDIDTNLKYNLHIIGINNVFLTII